MTPPRILITAGPTHEPIDAVRFVGNRSSGRMGVAIADAAAARGWDVDLLMGPAPAAPADARVRVTRFRTCEDLRRLLREHVVRADVLVMAAAVADYRPKIDPQFFGGKFRRKSETLVLELEPTPDLLAEVARVRTPSQLFVGFALEPREEMVAAAKAKMERKGIDMVVANPLETMDSDAIEATVLYRDGAPTRSAAKTSKIEAAAWLVDLIDAAWRTKAPASAAATGASA
ncbi:MAG TPA: phosphopantothenoylcysteine decarboxylase [Phycisphaerales bacterium]|nr:phosphopantothenoylcysteine decarboxylase [Phycisphaerales bacterium]